MGTALTDFDSKVEIPRADVTAKINWNFTRTEVAKIEVSCTILTPEKDDAAPIIVSEAQCQPCSLPSLKISQ